MATASDRVLYIGTNDGVYCAQPNGGEDWTEINKGIIYKEVWSLLQNPETGEILVGTGPASVFKSTDRGESWIDCEQLRSLPETKEWTFPNPPHVAHVKGLDVRGSRIMGAVEEGWVVRSTDNGQTWQDIL